MGVEIMKRLGEHRCVVAVSPIRRHLRDPRRRKSLIYPATVEAASWLLSRAVYHFRCLPLAVVLGGAGPVSR